MVLCLKRAFQILDGIMEFVPDMQHVLVNSLTEDLWRHYYVTWYYYVNERLSSDHLKPVRRQ